MACSACLAFAEAPLPLISPLLLKFDLHASYQAHGISYETGLAVLSSLMGIGGVVGGAVVGIWGGLRSRRTYGVIVPLMISGAGMAVYGLSSHLPLTAVMGFAVVASSAVANAHVLSIWQRRTPPELQGRVFSLQRMVSQLGQPLSMLLAGMAAAAVDPGKVMAALGLLLLAFAVAQLRNRDLHQADPVLERNQVQRPTTW